MNNSTNKPTSFLSSRATLQSQRSPRLNAGGSWLRAGQLLLGLAVTLAACQPEVSGWGDEPLPPIQKDDWDLDGVPDAVDNCPQIANPKDSAGSQLLVCGSALGATIDETVFLRSGAFTAQKGLRNLDAGSGLGHVLIHFEESVGRQIGPLQRHALLQHDVLLWQYLPHRTHYATIPLDHAAIEAILALPFVRGITGLRPVDRLSTRVRRAADSNSRLEVAIELYPDADQRRFRAALERLGQAAEPDDDGVYRPTLEIETIGRLATSDDVLWIDRVAGEAVISQANDNSEGFEITGLENLATQHQFTGAGMTVAIAEVARMLETDHPAMVGRAQKVGSSALFAKRIEKIHAVAVAGMLIGDGQGTDVANRQGILTEAELVNYQVRARSPKGRSHGVPRSARNDHDAVVVNASWGNKGCSGLFTYGKDGKWTDTVVHDEGVPVVRSVGNTRGPDGDLAEEKCQKDGQSLPEGIPKNDISVGNWDLNTNAIEHRSAQGPSEDGRLKPDLVAPGTGTWVPIFDDNDDPSYMEATGASFSAPFVAGVYAQILEALVTEANVPVANALSVPPATVKALLIHSAKDVGPPGPDMLHGWGLVQADAAIRLAKANDETIIEDSVLTEDVHTLDLSGGGRYGLKVTLVWDDVPGSTNATPVLVNDLDLEIEDLTTGVIYYPLDVTNGGTCAGRRCDTVNNVEQVVVAPIGASGQLSAGDWEVRVRLETGGAAAQAYSLVVSPGCPVELYGNATLTAPLNCGYDPLEPAGVIIKADNVTLDCQFNSITGAGWDVDGFAGKYTGVLVEGRSNVRIEECTVGEFDIGIRVEDSSNVIVANTIVRDVGTSGLRLSGVNHTVSNSSVFNVYNDTGSGSGMRLLGTAHTVAGGAVIPYSSNGMDVFGSRTNGIRIVGGTDAGSHRIDGVTINGSKDGIFATGPLAGLTLVGNVISSPSDNGISLRGDVSEATLDRNRIEGFGSTSAGIYLKKETDGLLSLMVEDCDIVSNEITGDGFSEQTAIRMDYAGDCRVGNNLPIVDVGAGITDYAGHHNQIDGNEIESLDVGVKSEIGTANITGNTVTNAADGIVVEDPPIEAIIDSNIVVGTQTGVILSGARESSTTSVSQNEVDIALGGSGIIVSDTNDAVIEQNIVTYQPPIGTGALGISVANSDRALISDNQVSDVNECLVVGFAIDANVPANQLNRCAQTGLGISDDSGTLFSLNKFTDNSDVAIRYLSGSGSVVSGNSFAQTSTTTRGRTAITVGDPSSGIDLVIDLTIANHIVGGFIVGIRFGFGIVGVALSGNSVNALDVALHGMLTAYPAGTLDIRNNVLRGGNWDAQFSAAVDTENNDWSETAGMDIIDSDGDGFGDCGTDHVFSSQTYNGTEPNVARTSTMTVEVSDRAPVTTQSGSCP